MSEQPKKKRKMLTSFSIIFILLALVAVITIIQNGAAVTNSAGEVFTITGASLGQFMMAPVEGFKDAVDVCLFILVLGGFLGIVTKTDALNVGISKLVKSMGGNEVKLIPWLMLLFAVLGSTYGFCEETVGFYALLAATMMAAGYDALTGAAMILLGAAVGCLGSTVNPFATGIASSALTDMGIEVNQAIVIGLGVVLLLVSWAVSAFFVMKYAKKVKADPSTTLMTPDELAAAEETYGDAAAKSNEAVDLSGKQKAVLWIFGIAFLIMILGFVPWEDLGVSFFNSGYSSHEVATITGNDVAAAAKAADMTVDAQGNLVKDGEVVVEKANIDLIKGSDLVKDGVLDIAGTELVAANPETLDGLITYSQQTEQDSSGWSAFLTGTPLGEWYFAESTTWFLLLAIIIGIVYGMDEHEIVDEFMVGAGDMMSVVMIVAVSRGVSILMDQTGLSPYFLTKSATALNGANPVVFSIGSYLLYFVLSFLIPSTSGMATVSMPIMGPLAQSVGCDPAVMVMIFSAASGAVNMITPTNGAIMGGLALARVEYGTWFKFALKIVIATAIVSMIVLGIATLAFPGAPVM